jgi:hypothetical protein
MHIDRAAGRAAPFGFGGFAPGHNKIKALRHLQEVNNGTSHCCSRRAPVSHGSAAHSSPTCERRVTNRWFQQQVGQGWQHIPGQWTHLRLAPQASGAWVMACSKERPHDRDAARGGAQACRQPAR